MGTITLQTKQFGEYTFDEEIIINFEDGVIGFEDLTKYIIIHHEEDLFYWLTSVDQPEIVFPLFPVCLLLEEYPKKEGYEAFSIVKLAKEPANISVNLKAPLYINLESKKGYQTILDKEDYKVDFPLFLKGEDK